MYVRLGYNCGMKLHKQNTPPKILVFSENASISEGYIVYEVIFSSNSMLVDVSCKQNSQWCSY
jgi:hypothetical protein